MKPRVIDNYKASAINAAFGTSSHLDLHGTDIICCMLAFMLRIFTGERSIDTQVSNGKRLKGKRHPDFDTRPQLWGRGVDLSKAYKQVGIAPESLKHGALGVRLKDGSWRFFLSKSCKFQRADGAFSLAFQTGPLVRSVSLVRLPSYLGCCVVFPHSEKSNLNAFETFLSGI